MKEIPDYREAAEAADETKPDMRLGFVLLEDEAIDWEAFLGNLKADWGMVLDTHPNDDNTLVFDWEDMMVADSIREDILPVPTWIYFGIYPDGDDFSGYTYGMTYFGMDEIEVIKTKAEPAELYDFLMDVAYYVIDNDVVLANGETLGFSEEQKLAVTRSEGVAVEGESIKIGF